MADLDPRKRTILRTIIVEYVSTAEPVGSESLVAKYPLGVKSATVRNEMAELLDLGLLAQPHTSAGRIPSDAGYRYYVDQLVIARELDQSTRDHLVEVTHDGSALQSILRDAARVLSQLTRLLTVATTVKEPKLTIRTAVVSAMSPNQVLFVVALSNGQIENRMLEVPADLTLADVGVANEVLATQLVGKSVRGLRRLPVPSGGSNPVVERLLAVAWQQLRVMERTFQRGTVITEGEQHLITQPEFHRDVESFQTLLQEIGNSESIYDVVNAAESGQVVTIGSENRRETMRAFSVVRQPFYVGNDEAGVIAVVGPTRMRYDDSIPLVNFTANALSMSLSRYFASGLSDPIT